MIEPLPEPRHLLGYSLGARVGLGLLVRFPGLLASATLVGVNPGLQTESERQERRQADRSWIELLETDGVDGWISQWEALPLFQTQQRLRAEQLEAQRQLRRAHTAQGLQASLRELGLAQMPNYWSELASIPTPVTLVVGQEDEKFTQLAQATVGHLTSGRVVVIPDAGHNPILEAPAAVGRLLAETLQLSGSQPHPEEASP